MSRASNLAKAIGADGTLNVADVAGLAAVASSGSASDLSTGTLPIARIADGAVTSAKIADGTIATGDIADGAITYAKLSSDVQGDMNMFKNRIINGAMTIDQRNNGASVTTSVLQTLTFTLDRWGYYNDVVSKRTIQQVTTAPPGFKNSLKVTVVATDTVGPQQFLRQSIEGFNIADFGWGTANAQPVTLSFWVRSSVTGQHGGSLQNSNSARSYPFAYTINSADTWEYKTIAISGDTSGSWSTDNGIGIAVQFENGPGYQKATAGTWVGQNSTSSTGSVNLCATNGATWYLTGVQLEKGSTATSFDYRPIGTELALCHRYYIIVPALVAHHMGYTSSTMMAAYNTPVAMRAPPSIGLTTTSPYAENQPWQSVGSLTSASISYNGSHFNILGGEMKINGTWSPTPASGQPWMIGGQEGTNKLACGGPIFLTAEL